MGWYNQSGGGPWGGGPWGGPPRGGNGQISARPRPAAARFRGAAAPRPGSAAPPDAGRHRQRPRAFSISSSRSSCCGWRAASTASCPTSRASFCASANTPIRPSPASIGSSRRPIESVLKPKVTRVNRLEVGFRAGIEGASPTRGGATQIPEEALMLTGDENIVDINFTVFWLINDARNYPLQHPQPRRHREGGGGKRDARGGRPDADRRDPRRRPQADRDRHAEAAPGHPRQLRRRHHRDRGPAPEGRSAGARSSTRSATCSALAPTRSASATRPRPIATASCRSPAARPCASSRRPRPTSSRSSRRRKARHAALPFGLRRLCDLEGRDDAAHLHRDDGRDPEATPTRSSSTSRRRAPPASCPICRCRSSTRPASRRRRCSRASKAAGRVSTRRKCRRCSGGRSHEPRRPHRRDRRRGRRHLRRDRARSSSSTRPSRRSSCSSASSSGRSAIPGLHVKLPLVQNVVYYDRRVLDIEPPTEEVIASDQKRLVVDSYARFRILDPLQFYQSVGTELAARSRLNSIISASLRRVLGNVTLGSVLSDERAKIMKQATEEVKQQATAPRHRGHRRPAAPRRPARGEQPGDLRAHAVGAAARGAGVPCAGRRVRAAHPLGRRARAHGDHRRGAAPVADPARRGRRRERSRSMPTRSARIRISSRSTARCRPIATRSAAATPRWCCRPTASSSAISAMVGCCRPKPRRSPDAPRSHRG